MVVVVDVSVGSRGLLAVMRLVRGVGGDVQWFVTRSTVGGIWRLV